MDRFKRSSLSLDFVGAGNSFSKLLFKSKNSCDSPAWQLSDSFTLEKQQPEAPARSKKKNRRVRPASTGGLGLGRARPSSTLVFRSPSIYEDEEER